MVLDFKSLISFLSLCYYISSRSDSENKTQPCDPPIRETALIPGLIPRGFPTTRMAYCVDQKTNSNGVSPLTEVLLIPVVLDFKSFIRDSSLGYHQFLVHLSGECSDSGYNTQACDSPIRETTSIPGLIPREFLKTRIPRVFPRSKPFRYGIP